MNALQYYNVRTSLMMSQLLRFWCLFSQLRPAAKNHQNGVSVTLLRTFVRSSAFNLLFNKIFFCFYTQAGCLAPISQDIFICMVGTNQGFSGCSKQKSLDRIKQISKDITIVSCQSCICILDKFDSNCSIHKNVKIRKRLQKDIWHQSVKDSPLFFLFIARSLWPSAWSHGKKCPC